VSSEYGICPTACGSDILRGFGETAMRREGKRMPLPEAGVYVVGHAVGAE
jgi:hypothetical protein